MFYIIIGIYGAVMYSLGVSKQAGQISDMTSIIAGTLLTFGTLTVLKLLGDF